MDWKAADPRCRSDRGGRWEGEIRVWARSARGLGALPGAPGRVCAGKVVLLGGGVPCAAGIAVGSESQKLVCRGASAGRGGAVSHHQEGAVDVTTAHSSHAGSITATHSNTCTCWDTPTHRQAGEAPPQWEVPAWTHIPRPLTRRGIPHATPGCSSDRFPQQGFLVSPGQLCNREVTGLGARSFGWTGVGS